jgi:hypothetical protein
MSAKKWPLLMFVMTSSILGLCFICCCGDKRGPHGLYLCQHAFDPTGKWSNATVQLSHRFIKVTSWCEFMVRKNDTGTLKIATDLLMLIMMTRC